MNLAWAYWGGLFALSVLTGAAHGQVFLWWLGTPSSQNAVSSLSSNGQVAVIGGTVWSSTSGKITLPDPPEPSASQPIAVLVSGDASVVVGGYHRAGESVRFHLRGGVYRDISTHGDISPGVLSTAGAVNSDGSRVFLYSTGGGESFPQGNLWREHDPMVSLYYNSSLTGFAASDDFSVLFVSLNGGCRTYLNDVLGPAWAPYEFPWTVRVHATNQDGSIIIGQVSIPPISYRWDNHVGSPMPTLVGTPLAITDDGAAIVTSQNVWTSANPAIGHRDYLTSRGAMFAPGAVTISLVSADFTTFAGVATSPTGPGQQRFIIQFRTSGCDSIDFNNDGLLPDVHDIQEFLSVFSGQGCGTATCNDIDFNNDGQFPDVEDIDALMRVFAGGSYD